MRELTTDILIVGGGTGGVAGALSAAEMLGRSGRVLLAAGPGWLGGQFTTQGVPPDENQWVETFGSNRSYGALRERVRAIYRSEKRLTAAAMAERALNAGGGWVSRLCAEPRIWNRAIEDALAPSIASGTLTVERDLIPERAETHGDRVRSVTFRHARGGEAITVRAGLVLDATEWGDVWELAGIEHAIGAEHRDEYGEMHGRTDRADPLDQQACSWCFALEHRPGEDHTIPRPARYAFWREFTPRMTDGSAWTGPLFSWTVPSHNAEGKRTFRMVPWPDEPERGEWEMWRYRRIVDSAAHERGAGAVDVSLINMVQMDYWLRPLLGVSAEERERALMEAREQSLCLLHWMQTEAPRHDSKGAGYPGLRLRGDELGTSDGLAQHVYVREPRRLLARTMMTERHVGTDQRRADGCATSALNWDRAPGGWNGLGTGEPFVDSVGIGHYTIDLHPSCAGRNSVYVPCAPFRIPMGALIPRRVRNVLAAGKGLGVSHVANGATRMHQVEWSVGEAAGTLAAWCIMHGREPHAVHESVDHVRDVQRVLGERGVVMAWPWEG